MQRQSQCETLLCARVLDVHLQARLLRSAALYIMNLVQKYVIFLHAGK